MQQREGENLRNLIIGSSGGIGQAIANELRDAGQEVVGLSRSADGLDITSEKDVIDAARTLSGEFDRILVVTGALRDGDHLPEKTIKSIDPEAMQVLFAINALGPALCLKHFYELLPKDRRSVFACFSARVGSIGDNRLGGWVSYRASKAALNQIVRTSAIEIARKRPQAICVAYHPGTVQTDLTQQFLTGHSYVSPQEAARNAVRVFDNLSEKETGRFFDWRGEEVLW